MQWLLSFLYGLVQNFFTYFVKKYTFKLATFFAWATFVVGSFIAFVSFIELTLLGIEPILPEGALFVAGFFPPLAKNFAEIYFTVLVAKRVFDWKQHLGKSYYQTKGMAY